MAKEGDIIYITSNEPPLVKMLLEPMGWTGVRFKDSFRADRAIDHIDKCLLVLELPLSFEEFQAEIDRFVSARNLYRNPVILISAFAPEKYEYDFNRVRRYNSKAKIIGLPSGASSNSAYLINFLGPLFGLKPSQVEELAEQAGASRERIIVETPPEIAQESAPSTASNRVQKKRAQGIPSKPKSSPADAAALLEAGGKLRGSSLELACQYFDAVQEFFKDGNYVGGNQYIQSKAEDAILDKSYIPTFEKNTEVIEQSLALCSPWERNHLHRVAYLTHRVLLNLEFEPNWLEIGSTLAFSFAYPFGLSNEKISRIPFTRSKQKSVEDDFTRMLTANIEELEEQKQNEHLLPGLRAMRSVILKDINEVDELNYCLASTVLLGIIYDRECWYNNHWSQTAAHQLLRWLERGDGERFHHSAVVQYIRLLMEAIEATPMRVAAGPAQDVEEGSGEKMVRFSELVPGMRLSRPVETIDGRILVKANTVIDADLAWRMWRALAVAQLKAPKIYLDDKGKRVTNLD